MALNLIRQRWAGTKRSEITAALNPGIVSGGQYSARNYRVRCSELDVFDQYVEGTQYDKLADWDAPGVALRQRKPRVIYNFAKRIVNTFSSKMLGSSVFPKIRIEDDEESDFALQMVLKLMKLERYMPEAMRRLAASGSVCVTFALIAGAPKLNVYNSKYCYPEFDDNGELTKVLIRYTYLDSADVNQYGKPKEKWYQLELTQTVDTLFDNPEVTSEGNSAPVFQVVSEVQHDLGFVQAEWFKSTEEKHTLDGPSLLKDVTSLIDEINYSLSQSSQALGYSQEPQLTLSGMDIEELDKLPRNSREAWNLGRDGKAAFIEADLHGVERAGEHRNRLRLAIQDVARVIMHDPEKVGGFAQSGEALELLNAPLVDLVTEYRPHVEERLLALVAKVLFTMVIVNGRGEQLAITMPRRWVPKSMNIQAHWPSVFAETVEDKDKIAKSAIAAANAQIISRETALRKIADQYGIEDIDAEIAKIAAQPQINPFGAF